VWSIRVDVHFLDHDGNIIDAACIAAISALAHFRRPDTTVIGEEVTIVFIKNFFFFSHLYASVLFELTNV
jgi:exosome complex RNA-binding protein Rrp42 (RNase PH superfamily)